LLGWKRVAGEVEGRARSETQRLEVAREQIRKLEGDRNQAMAQAEQAGAEGDEPIHQVVKLAKLKGSGRRAHGCS